MSSTFEGGATGAQNVAKLFEFTYNVVRQNVEGFSHEEALQQPDRAGNCLNWVLGHIVATRNHLVQLLGKEPFWTAEQITPYDRGSTPVTDPDKAMHWDTILRDFDSSQELVRAGLATMTTEQLNAPLPEDRNPFGLDSVGMMIGAFNFHEAYHAGQTGILRRVYGKAGAIK